MAILQNSLAAITGGGSGISLAFAKRVYEAGCSVLIADIALHSTAREWLDSIKAKDPSSNPRIEFLRTDVTDWHQLERIFTFSQETFGTVPDIVVPGAGVYEPSSNSFWEDTDRDSHYKVLDINLVHPIKLSRLAVRYLVDGNKTGTIILISSIAGQRSSIVTPLYTASKHGINSFVRGMANLEELAGIRVMGVAPGTVGTPLFTDHPEAAKFLDMEKDALLAPEDVAAAMFGLLVNKQYSSGTVLEVCDPSQWRVTSLLNDPGPSGMASFTSRKNEVLNGIMKHLSKDGGATIPDAFKATTD